MTDFRLQTERLCLREATLADAPFMLRLLSEPAWKKFIAEHDVHDEAGARNYLADRILPAYTEGRGLWLALLKDTKEAIGICGLVKRPFLDQTDLGFALLSDYAGAGLAAEASKAVIEYSKETLCLELLWAITVAENSKSIRLLRHLGFTFKEEVCNPSGDTLSLYELNLNAKAPSGINLL